MNASHSVWRVLGACALGCVRVGDATAVSALRQETAIIGSCDDRTTRLTNDALRAIIRVARNVLRPYSPAHASSAQVGSRSVRPWVAGGSLALHDSRRHWSAATCGRK